jgi:dipeptidyl aminopeptidase/acylaminoacyl peptidase
MSAVRPLESRLPQVLEDISGPRTPDYFDDILGQVGRTRQRPGWTFPERWLPMTALSERVATAPRISAPLAVGLALLLLILVAGLVLVAGSQPRLPAPFGPAGNGRLALAESGDIYVMDPNTGDRTLAIGGATDDSSPVFSRDGTRIAFYRAEGREQRLVVADADGRNVHELATEGLVDPSGIQWSPDGRSILVNVTYTGGVTAAIVQLDGASARSIDFAMPAEDAVWLPPDGQWILFRTPGPTGYGLAIARPDGTEVRTLVPPTGTSEWDALYFDVSPDGSQVAYQWRDDDGIQKIYVVSIFGGGRRSVTTIESVLPRWSPDGESITFGSDRGAYIVPGDGSGPERQLVPVSAAADSLRSMWSPDGSKVLFLSTDGRPFLIDPAGGPSIEASWTADELPDWQRVGDRR